MYICITVTKRYTMAHKDGKKVRTLWMDEYLATEIEKLAAKDSRSATAYINLVLLNHVESLNE